MQVCRHLHGLLTVLALWSWQVKQHQGSKCTRMDNWIDSPTSLSTHSFVQCDCCGNRLCLECLIYSTTPCSQTLLPVESGHVILKGLFATLNSTIQVNKSNAWTRPIKVSWLCCSCSSQWLYSDAMSNMLRLKKNKCTWHMFATIYIVVEDMKVPGMILCAFIYRFVRYWLTCTLGPTPQVINDSAQWAV